MKLYKYDCPDQRTDEYSYFGANYKSFVKNKLMKNCNNDWSSVEYTYRTQYSYLNLRFDKENKILNIELSKPFGYHKNCSFTILIYRSKYYAIRFINEDQSKYIKKKLKIKLGTKVY